MGTSDRPITVALAGNPNCGKTTLFNALTGARQRVGNWPGVTVERVEGAYRHRDAEVRVVDLPGIYSFSADSLDEKIAREFLLRERPDVVVNIVDATNLERNLYLTLQLLEMRVPVVVALNMSDLLKPRGVSVQVPHLERHLGCRVVPTVASRKQGVPELRDAVADAAASRRPPPARAAYDPEVEEAIALIGERVREAAHRAGADPRWMAIKLLERDPAAIEWTADVAHDLVESEIRRIERHTGTAMDIVIADGRYGIIHGLARDVVRRDEPLRRSVSDAMDRVLLNGALGLPIFAGVMCLVFLAAMRLGAPFIEFFEKASRAVFMDGVRALLGLLPAPALLVTLVADGAGGGIRAVAALVPPVFFIFLFLAVLEDSGYMARAAFLMDHLLRRVGLPGKAFVPLLTGFGCNVPAILAARTLDDERDRLVTILINPFMSCGARFPVYTLFAVAFFPEHGPAVIFALYLTGVALALLTALALRRTLFRGEPAAFVMELPPYHLPTPGGVLHHAWRRLSGFVLRAGKVIVLFVVALTLLNSVGADGALSPSGSSDSALRQAGKRLTPLFGPMGIRRDNWPAVVGLFSGMLAKEAVVGTLDALYTQMEGRAPAAPDGAAAGVGAGLREAFMAIPRGFFPRGPGDGGGGEGGVSAGTFRELREHFGERAAAFAYLLFVLIYVPCVATIAAIRREAGPGWAAFAVAYLTGLAWVVATAYYQAATFAFHPVSSAAWLSLCAAAVAAFLAGLELRGRAMRKGMRR